MDVTIHLKRLPGDEAGTPVYVPHLPCSGWGLPSSISHLMDWCAFTAPFHLYNALRRCSLLSVALSIASPLLGVTQHPALWSPDFPHPDGWITIRTRPSTQLKSFYYNPSGNLNAMKLTGRWVCKYFVKSCRCHPYGVRGWGFIPFYRDTTPTGLKRDHSTNRPSVLQEAEMP